MKIAHLTTVDSSLRYLLLPQLLAARDQGHEVLGISAPGPDVAFLEAAGVRHVALRSASRGADLRADLRACHELWQILRDEAPDLLHTHNPKPGVYGRVLGRLAGVPAVVNTVHGLYATPEDPLLERVVVYGLEAVASRCSDAELVQNEEDLALLAAHRLAPRRRLTLLGNGVDLARFDRCRVTSADREATRRDLGVGPGQVVVGYVGRLVAEKGLPELFEAMELLDDRYVLVVVGPEDPVKADALTATDLDAARQRGVRLLGHRADVDGLYAALDVFVLPSHREGFPRAAMEAAAMGLPVVATDIRGCRQVVEDGVNGMLVPVRDPVALAGAIRTLGDDPDRAAAMGAAGADRARTHFDERRVVDRVLRTYDEVTSGARPRRGALAVKRALDVVGGAVLLAVTAPVVGLAALAVLVTMGRPVLFTQVRPGRGGVPFHLHKLRTMREVADPDTGRPLEDGQRITAVGRFLRATSIDELPELVDVIRGRMSLVGPRPLLVDYLDRYTPRQARRHRMRPGLTGWAQLHGRNAVSWEERLDLDVWYVEHWSLRLDLRILARTLGMVLRREGISQSGHATMPEFEG